VFPCGSYRQAFIVERRYCDSKCRLLINLVNCRCRQIGRNLVATFLHLRHGKQWLIIPLTMYSGLEQTAFNAELSQVIWHCYYFAG